MTEMTELIFVIGPVFISKKNQTNILLVFKNLVNLEKIHVH